MDLDSLNYNEKDVVFNYLNNPRLPAVNTEYAWTKERVLELDKCRKDIVYFAEHYFYITTDEGKKKIKLYKAQKRVLRALEKNRMVVCLASRQVGKALALDTPIPTPDGWKTMGSLKTGEYVFDNYGNPTKILKAWDVMYDRPCYEITFDNGEKIVADKDHLWMTETFNERRRGHGERTKRTTGEIFNSLMYKNGHQQQSNHGIKITLPLKYPKNDNLPINPYVLGLWLGDGNRNESKITVGNTCIVETENVLADHGFLKNQNFKSYKQKDGSWIISFIGNHENTGKTFRKLLREMNLYKNKHIPQLYLKATVEERKELLRGMMDTDGSMSNQSCTFYNTDKILIDSLQELLSSLGIKYSIKEKKYRNFHNGKQVKDIYRVHFKTNIPAFNLPSKLHKQNTKTDVRGEYHYIVDVKSVPSVPVRCITVDSEDAMFLCGKTCIPTSNTTLMTIFTLWMACFRGDYRVILVANKEATAKNMLKRIKMSYEYLPNWLKPTIKTWDVKEISLGNDSSIAITTTTSTAARGDTANCVVIDEGAHIPYNLMDEFWKSVIPVISSSTKSKVFMISTANGTGNKFYEVYSEAERSQGASGWVAQRIDWWEVPGRDERWKRATIAALGSLEAFNQEFDNTFIATGESAISSEVISKYRKEATPPKIELMERCYKIWEAPKPKRLYVIGADVGEGIGSTASTIQVMDMTDLTKIKQVATYRNQYINPYSFTKVLYEIAGQWGSPYIFMERNNVGGGILDTLFNTFKYEKIANYVPNNGEENFERMGIYSHTNTKLESVTNMRYWINDLQAVEVNDITTIQEFETFVKYPNGTWKKKLGENLYDDMVMALAWALFALKTELCERYYEILQYDDKGKPLKIAKSMYDEEVFFGSQTLRKNFNDSDPLPAIIAQPISLNEGVEDMMGNGWAFMGDRRY